MQETTMQEQTIEATTDYPVEQLTGRRALYADVVRQRDTLDQRVVDAAAEVQDAAEALERCEYVRLSRRLARAQERHEQAVMAAMRQRGSLERRLIEDCPEWCQRLRGQLSGLQQRLSMNPTEENCRLARELGDILSRFDSLLLSPDPETKCKAVLDRFSKALVGGGIQ